MQVRTGFIVYCTQCCWLTTLCTQKESRQRDELEGEEKVSNASFQFPKYGTVQHLGTISVPIGRLQDMSSNGPQSNLVFHLSHF